MKYYIILIILIIKIYNINKNYNEIKLFGNDFIKNNINNCYLLIYGKENKL